ncbi:MAG: cob(I)yrinic acid a,c-diamide adenosyltransferase [Bauldia sp.]|uniref:cob(I)yrinic acid a,c-diamide adenosyltransferase n=1 Tax=Bauldia sp. TaxID=2575872 RepID=UPI001D705B44|nr:cob(I)yrinic acid a,c-diamide adenosyltransferase [Bauldia sp.]MCB1494247.1 cob(I)yrinic acid a,c-diamide adenosyltransferase [Bauldia sp.]
MVVLNKIYTRTGDDGTSALATGERRPKSDLRFQAIGTVDELNATIGIARLSAAGTASDGMLARIQNDLFDLGADLAVPQEGGRHERLRIVDSQVSRLESEIDALNDSLQPLTSFILPGGSPLAAALHLSRTVARRAERTMVDLDAYEPVNPVALTYINRLSDFLFVAARTANDGGASDVLWIPGENR